MGTGMRMRSTICDVAREAGVSTMTVTRAFREDAKVAPETRRRVIATAERLNFNPDLNARGLRGGATHSIGLLLSNPGVNPLVRRLSHNFMEKHYVTFVADSLGDAEITETALRDFIARRVDGVVMGWRAHFAIRPQIAGLIEQIPALVFYTEDEFPPFPCSCCRVDYLNVYRGVINSFLAEGRKKIVYLGKAGYIVTETCLAALESLGLSREMHYWDISAYPSQPHYANCATALADRLKAGEVPDVILTGNDIGAAQLCSCLRRHGIAVPERTAVIGMNNNPMSEFCEPPVATIDGNSIQAADALCQMMMERIDAPDREFRQIQIKAEYIPRKSGGIKFQNQYESQETYQ